MEPAILSSCSGHKYGYDNAREKSEKTKNDETTRRGKLKIRIQVGDLRAVLSAIEQELVGLRQKYEAASSIGEQRCPKRSTKSPPKTEPLLEESSELDVDEKDIVPEKDVGFLPHKSFSKLPVLDKTKLEDSPKVFTTDILNKVVGLETLYGVLMEEHLGLQLTLQDTSRRLRAEERRARELEERRNPINLALAEQLGLLQAELEGLRRTVADLREENDHLEFRLLEMDELPIKKTVYRSSAESTKYDPTDLDDVSDSGVMSLPASDDEHTDFSLEAKSDSDVKGRLLSLSQNSAVGDRICIQQGLALLRHYEARIESLESTIAAMCHDATLSRNVPSNDEVKGPSRIIATVLPFTERKESCYLQESGIFEEEWTSRGTQTEPSAEVESGELSTELEKLSMIREKMETRCPSELPPVKQLAFYKARVETLESRLEAYQAKPDDASRLIAKRLEKEARLEAEISRLKEKVEKLQALNRELEEEKCELEEAENDTRLRCQKLEFKLSALGEKKNCLKAQLDHLSHEMASREEERKNSDQMEVIIENYEKKNKELEEREMELKYKLQMYENTMPALFMWNMWRTISMAQASGVPPEQGMPGSQASTGIPTMQGMTMHSLQGMTMPTVQNMAMPTVHNMAMPSAQSMKIPSIHPNNPHEEELILRLQSLESRLNTEKKLLQESKMNEEILRNKIADLEHVLESKDTNILHILKREPGQDIEAFEKLSKMAKDRVEMDRRIKDLLLKEKMYKETLQQVDNLFSDLEGNYNKQLKEKDDILHEQKNKLAETEFKLKQSHSLSEINMQMQEKLNHLEADMKNLTDALKKRELEREALEAEEKRLNDELTECLQELDSLKKQIEGPMKGQLEVSRKKAATLEEELERAHNSRLALEAERRNERQLYEKRLNQLTKELMESDVTIGELREEVQTLESAIDDYRYQIKSQEGEKEDLRHYYEAKLEEKERQIDELKESIKLKPPVKSLKEELEELMSEVQMDMKSGNGFLFTEEKSQGIRVHDQMGDFKREIIESIHTKEVPDTRDKTKDSVNLELTVQTEKTDLKSKEMLMYDDIINERDRLEPLLDNKSSEGTHTDVLQHPNNMANKCDIAHMAVTSQKDISGKLNNINQAFQHSKICKSCNNTLGVFFSDLIKELGVQLPSNHLLGNCQL